MSKSDQDLIIVIEQLHHNNKALDDLAKEVKRDNRWTKGFCLILLVVVAFSVAVIVLK